jgi:translocation and assembly module TamA
MATQISLNANASYVSQKINASADWFVWKNKPRQSIYTQIELFHENQADYEQTIYTFKPAVKWTRDSEGFSKLYTLGPSYEGGTYYSNTNSSTRSYKTGIIDSFLQWMSHDYELFDILPQQGQLYTLNFDYRDTNFGFLADDLLIDFSTVQARRISNWGRGTLIGAGRFSFGTSWVDTNQASISVLPPSVKFFGGGSDDVRGFYLNTLPENGGLGALTKMLAKLELRRTYLFIPSLEAFGFVDGAHFSEKSWTRDARLYYSPGAGLRWLSPFGLVQTFIARGLKSNPYEDAGNLYYVGIGGTF